MIRRIKIHILLKVTHYSKEIILLLILTLCFIFVELLYEITSNENRNNNFR